MPRLSRRLGLIALAVLLAVPVAALAFALAADAGMFRDPLIRLMESIAQRRIHIRGPMRVRLLTLHPSVHAQGVQIDNPPWTPPGSLGHLDLLTIAIDIPWFHRPFTIETLEIEGGELTLKRDWQDLANWQWVDPRTPGRRGLSFVRRMHIEHTRLVLDDEFRHLKFDGQVSTEDAPDTEGNPGATDRTAPPFRLHAQGTLNGRATSIDLASDPLATAQTGHPYHYAFREHSELGDIAGQGTLPEPFFLDRTQGMFDSTGQDLEALYQLAGVQLLRTGPYKFGGEFVRVGTTSEFHRLRFTSGESDVRGDLVIDSATPHSRIVVALASEQLRLKDLGPQAARNPPQKGAASSPGGGGHLPSQPLQLSGMRRSDALYVLSARRLEVGRYTLTSLFGRLRIERGIATLEQLVANGFGGRLIAHATLDSMRAEPALQLEARAENASLQDLASHHPAEAPLDAQLNARIALRGAGRSLQAMASSAAGSAQFYLSSGVMRDSLAELIGLDLRGLGLMLTKSKKETPIRCGAGDWLAQDGVLTARSLFLDTDKILIEGEGTINLGHESIDLTLRGYPKGVRILKLRSAIKVAGPLLHPSASIDTEHAKFSLIDVGKAKDVDCKAAPALSTRAAETS
ncbi:MAG TPA: AsmA family protein [Steroidobacteraceae bacterium]|nr:AsmA family protein [Steroidobacteraceae bacterium]